VNTAIHPASLAFHEAFTQSRGVGGLNFPTSLDTSRRILKAVENPDIGLAALAKIVISEPLLSAKTIRFANSVAINPGGQVISDVRLAVSRIGAEPLKTLTMALIINQLRQSHRFAMTRSLSNRLWERSIDVAALAYVITKKMTALNSDEAMFAGIVHDLGRFYLLAQAVNHPELLRQQTVLAETINEMEEAATLRIFEALKLPASTVEAVLASRQLTNSMPPESLGEILFIARALSPAQDPLSALDARRKASDLDKTAPLKLDKSCVAKIIAASGNEIHSIVTALEG
jgi:HD-like signal output (HDOD) protein